MEEGDAVASLERLGLTTYEAKVFIALQKLGSGTAREVSRVADVPRSQVYSVTESLEDRGLVEVQQSSPMQYRPVRIEEARKTLRERFETEAGRAFGYVESVRNERGGDNEEQEAIWTLTGRDHVSERTAELAEIRKQLAQDVLTPHKAAKRLWTFYEDEIRLAEENGVYQQTVTVAGEEKLADVARLGMMMLFFKTPDGDYGRALKEHGEWMYKVYRDEADRDQVKELFASFRKQVRTGFFTLPNALTGTEAL